MLDLPFARTAHDRAAHRRTDPDLVDKLLTLPTTRVLLLRGGALGAVGQRLGLFTPDDVVDVPADEHLFLGEAGGLSYVTRLVPDDADVVLPLRTAGGEDLVPRPAPSFAPRDSPALESPGSGHVPGEAGQDGVLAQAGEDLALAEGTQDPSDRPVGDVEAADGSGFAWLGLREVSEHATDLEQGLAVEAVALAAWLAVSGRCPRCGAEASVEQAGWVRRCTAEGVELYPRSDPAVIMAVVDDADRLLLGRAPAWAPGRYSVLAGFVEPGESAEHAVRREVLEEAAIEIGEGPGDVVYRSSQSWPFPASLMLGYRARARTTAIRTDDELADARWFTRDELAAAVAAGEIGLPGRASIARSLIEEWFGGEIDDGVTWR